MVACIPDRVCLAAIWLSDGSPLGGQATRALRAAFCAQRWGAKGVRTLFAPERQHRRKRVSKRHSGILGCEHLFALVFALWFALACSRDQPKRNAHAGWQGFSP